MTTENNKLSENWPENVIVPLSKPFIDDRGEIQPLVDVDIKSCVLISSKKGTVRANHYHKTDFHYCYVLEGSIEYYHRPVGSEEAHMEVIKKGQMFFTPPLVEHAMVFPEDSVFLAFGRNSRQQESYEGDLVRVQFIDPK